jgi:hypothetical protein
LEKQKCRQSVQLLSVPSGSSAPDRVGDVRLIYTLLLNSLSRLDTRYHLITVPLPLKLWQAKVSCMLPYKMEHFLGPVLSLGRHISVLYYKFMCTSAPRQMLKQQETVVSCVWMQCWMLSIEQVVM